MRRLKRIRNNLFRRDFTDEEMRAYFAKKDRRKQHLLAGSIIITAAFLITGCTSFFAGYGICIFFFFAAVACSLFAVIVWILILQEIRPPTDKEYDTWVKARAGQYLREELQKVDQGWRTDEEIERIFIRGFVLKGTKNAQNYRQQDILWKRGDDDIQRYSINVFRYFLPLPHKLVVFVIDINAVNSKDRRAENHQYFYSDIVGVTTINEHDEIIDANSTHEYLTQSFILRISDGIPERVTIRSKPLDHEEGLDEYALPDSDDIQSMIKELCWHIDSKKRGSSHVTNAKELDEDDIKDLSR